MATRLSPYRKVQPAALERRGDLRHAVTVSGATARELAEPPVAAVLNDLSSYGCRIGCALTPEPGTRLWLRLSGSIPIAATVVWCREGEVGCRFDQPIDTRLMRSLVALTH